MLFKITVLSVASQINGHRNSADLAFWGRSNVAIGFDNPQLYDLVIEDDEDQLASSMMEPGETGQLVHKDLTIGNYTITKGTRIDFVSGSLLSDQHGNEFIVMFPYAFDPTRPADGGTPLIPDRTAVLIVPVPREGIFAPFDLTNTFNFVGEFSVNADRPSITLPPYVPTTGGGGDTGGGTGGDGSGDGTGGGDTGGGGDDPGGGTGGDDGSGDGPICFAAGTLILTADGPRPVETLRAGDLVLTRDAGLQPILWAGGRHLGAAELDLAPNHRPIRIKAGALGPSQPARALVVSPQHRILMRSHIVRRMFDADEVLAPARLLVGLPGITVLRPPQGVAYHHLLLPGHHVIASEGAWTESLLPGPMALRALGPAARAAVLALVRPGSIAPARPVPPGRAIRSLVERLAKNPRRRVVEDDPQPAPAMAEA